MKLTSTRLLTAQAAACRSPSEQCFSCVRLLTVLACCRALVAQMLHIDAAARITIEDLHEHIWFSEPTEELPKEVVAASMQRFYDGGEDR